MSKNTKMKTLACCITAITAFFSIPFFSASAVTAPRLNIKNVTVQAEDLTKSRNVGVNLAVCENVDGFRSGSFGIRYDENLVYTGLQALTVTGNAFDVVCNPEEHMLWFSGAGGTAKSVASTIQDENIATLYFNIAEEIDGGDFALEFVWEGLDGSQASWYTDTQTNKIDTMRENSLNGKISLFNPDSEAMSEPELRINPNSQKQLEIMNASGDILWFSSNPEIATVDQTGLVTAVSTGKCQIQAFINNHILTCNLTVADGCYYNITDNGAVNITDQTTKNIMEYPDAIGTVTWISVNPGIVSVDSDGILHAVSNGVTNILGTYNGKTYMRIVSVRLVSEEIKGDADGDGEIGVTDVVVLQKWLLGESELPNWKNADLHEDGVINIYDLLILKQMLIK